MSYDYKDLKNSLADYFGTAMHAGNPAAMMDLIHVQQATDEEMLLIAQQNGFDLSEYATDTDHNFRK